MKAKGDYFIWTLAWAKIEYNNKSKGEDFRSTLCVHNVRTCAEANVNMFYGCHAHRMHDNMEMMTMIYACKTSSARKIVGNSSVRSSGLGIRLWVLKVDERTMYDKCLL